MPLTTRSGLHGKTFSKAIFTQSTGVPEQAYIPSSIFFTLTGCVGVMQQAAPLRALSGATMIQLPSVFIMLARKRIPCA
jgi:hypothetical protein